MTIFSIRYMWEKGGGRMETKNNLAWNDCERCKHYNFCYYMPTTMPGSDMYEPNIIVSNRKRNMCVNNGKRLFSAKD